jgi:hypothetical protein
MKMKLNEVMTSGEVVKVYNLNTLATLTLPDHGIAARNGMGLARIATERVFEAKRVLCVGYDMFHDNIDVLVSFFERYISVMFDISDKRYGDREEWVTAHEASSAIEVSREWVYRCSDFRGGDKIRTIEFGRVRLFWKEDVNLMARERLGAHAGG